MKIIYLVESRFCDRDFDRFGLDLLKQRGYKDIEVWDLSAWFRPGYFNKYTPKDLLTGDCFKNIASKEEVERILKFTPVNTIFICIFRPNVQSMSIFHYLNRHNIRYGFLHFGRYPSHSVRSRIKQAYGRKIFVLKQLINSLGVRILNLVSTPITPAFVILGGGATSNKYIDEKTAVLKTHTLDYDLFLNFSRNGKNNLEKDKYVVFIDDYAPYHPDNIARTNIDGGLYYSILNNFFSEIESKTGMRVVIAPHPRSDYGSIGNPFDGRTISSDPTIQVVAESSLVVSHGSTATSFAVLFNKPLLFMENPLYSPYVREFSHTMANFFDKVAVDISSPGDFLDSVDLSIDDDIYAKYTELYIKESNTPEKLNWDIFADYLDSIE